MSLYSHRGITLLRLRAFCYSATKSARVFRSPVQSYAINLQTVVNIRSTAYLEHNMHNQTD